MQIPWRKDIPPLMPARLREAMLAMRSDDARGLREIRIPARGPVSVIGGIHGFLADNGEVTAAPGRAVGLEPGQCRQIFEAITGHAPYACLGDICRGFVTIPGGYRVGLAGEVATENGRVTHLKSVSSLSIRIVRAICGAADEVMPMLAPPGRSAVRSALIISPPGMGKTTLIRDIARQLSDGGRGRSGVRVAVVDERGEIGGCRDGIPLMDVGVRTDILDGCPKSAGLLWAVRSLSPRAVVTDEIGAAEDVDALLEARNAGVAVIASAHGAGLKEMLRRPALRRLAEEALFELYVVLGAERPGVIREIIRGEQMKNGGQVDRNGPVVSLV